MPIGEVFLAAILQPLVQQLVSTIAAEFVGRGNIKIHLNDLTRTLKYIQAVIDDAEEKQLTDEYVKVWLEDLKGLIYELDDLLDEITSSVQKPTGRFFNKKIVGFFVNREMISKIKDFTGRLDAVAQLRTNYNLKEYSGGPANRSLFIRDPSSSLVNESAVFGRDEQKREIMERLFENNMRTDGPLVIPIIGMGGIGKTTLAQLVYNDKDVKENFDVRAWVCVSDEFDLFSITEKIYESITGNRKELKNFSTLQESLKAKLKNRKFLIVLDDVWNEDYEKWDKLCLPFQDGAPETRIIVTARSQRVADKVNCHGYAFHMKVLSDEACASLLARHVGASFLDNTELKDFGMELVKKCKGLPLAAKVLGGLLRSKETKEEWENILHSNIWNSTMEKNILPVLRLSYRHLPLHLKPLFAFCSVFPKDYEFDEKKLIYLWMGEGFLEQHHESNKTRIELGRECFKELLSRSFFQRSSGDISTFVMHDLLHDLAQSVAEGTCCHLDCKIDNTEAFKIPEKTRHCSIIPCSYEISGKFKTFYQIRGLRTLLQLHDNVYPEFSRSSTKILTQLVPRLHHLRVLSLYCTGSIVELLDSILELIHLRYLDLSGNDIGILPPSIGKLVNLYYLDLSETGIVVVPASIGELKDLCYLNLSVNKIVTLPDSIGKLIDLCYLNLSGTDIVTLPDSLGGLSRLETLSLVDTRNLQDMPIEIGQLKTLQEFPVVVLGKGDCFGLKELRELELLRGSLTISGLQDVVDMEDVNAGCMRSKANLDELSLIWGRKDTTDFCRYVFMDGPVEAIPQEDVIESLQPHENLRGLKIWGYRGTAIPSWIGDHSYNKLSSVGIISWFECTCLPPLGQLPNLKILMIESMRKVKCIGAEFYGSGAMICFPKLERLTFRDLPEWEEWTACPVNDGGDDDDDQIHFPQLQSLGISDCGNLMFLPNDMRNLRLLYISGCHKLVTLPQNGLYSTLTLHDCSGLTSLPNISGIEKLHISGGSSLQAGPMINYPTALKTLTIWGNCISESMFSDNSLIRLEKLHLKNWRNSNSILLRFSALEHLVKLELYKCDDIRHFSDVVLPPRLRQVSINSCASLESLPESIGTMASIVEIYILACPSLDNFPNFDLPPNLSALRVGNSKILKPLTQWGLHGLSSLREFRIDGGFEDLELLGDDDCLFPPSLETLEISNFPKLTSLAKVLENLKSLRWLCVEQCPNLSVLPSKRILQNISWLDIFGCPHLEKMRIFRD